MRDPLTRERLRALMEALGGAAPSDGDFRVYLVGGGTAVYIGWRETSIDADLYSDDERVFRGIQQIKERLNLNVEFARPEHFVPPLAGTEGRHLFIDTFGPVGFYHYDPYAQVLSKIVRGFTRDLADARSFVASGMVDPATLLDLVVSIPESKYARYPNLTAAAVLDAVRLFVAGL